MRPDAFGASLPVRTPCAGSSDIAASPLLNPLARNPPGRAPPAAEPGHTPTALRMRTRDLRRYAHPPAANVPPASSSDDGSGTGVHCSTTLAPCTDVTNEPWG